MVGSEAKSPEKRVQKTEELYQNARSIALHKNENGLQNVYFLSPTFHQGVVTNLSLVTVHF